MDDVWGEVLTEFLKILVATLLPVALYYVRQWLVLRMAEMKANLGEKQTTQVDWVLRTLVKAAEQSGLNDAAWSEGSKKKEWVLGEAQRWLTGMGIPIDLQAIDAQVEAIVKEFNDGGWKTAASTDDNASQGKTV